MKSNFKFRIITIVAVILICIYGVIGIPTSKDSIVETWEKNNRLGTDLKGGSQLGVQVQLQDAFKGEADAVIERIKDAAGKAGIAINDISRNDPKTIQEAGTIQINIRGVDPNKAGDFRTLINEQFGGVWILGSSGNDFRMTMKTSEALKLRDSTLAQTTNTLQKKTRPMGLAPTTSRARAS